MKLKAIALAAMLMGSGAVFAAPTMQTCAPMEVTHNGGSGLSYSLSCDAGAWKLQYTGSVPAGTEAIMANYRLQVKNADGSNFTQTRSARLPSPAMLGQALIREAVLLDGGDLALRDCPDFGCTLYRPLGSAEKLAKATITVTPEVKRLADEAARLSVELAQRQSDLVAQGVKVSGLEKDVQYLTDSLKSAQQAFDEAKAAHEAALTSQREQTIADVNGLLVSGKADVAKADAAWAAKLTAREGELSAQLAESNAALAKAHEACAESQVALQAAQQSKASVDAAVSAQTKDVQDLQAALTAAKADAQALVSSYEAKLGELTAKSAKVEAQATVDLDALRAERDVANHQILNLADRIQALELNLKSVAEQLKAAEQAQAASAAAVSSAAETQAKDRAAQEAALFDAQAALAQLTAARATEMTAAAATLADVNAKLVSATEALASKQAALDQAALGAAADTASVAALSAQTAASQATVAALKVAMAELETALAGAQKAQADAVAQQQQFAIDSVGSAEQQAAQVAQARAAAASAEKALADAQAAHQADSVGLVAKVAAMEVALATAQQALQAAVTTQADSVATQQRVSVEQAAVTEQHGKLVAAAQAAAAAAQNALADAEATHQVEVAQLTAKLAAQLDDKSAQATATASLEALRAELAQVTASRDEAAAQVAVLTEQLTGAATEFEALVDGRLEALRGAQQVAKDMLEVLDQFQDLQRAKQDVDAALVSSTHKVMELNTKLEAAGMARELAMQAAAVANADADTQNMKAQSLLERLDKTQTRLAMADSERDAVVRKLASVKDELATAVAAKGSNSADVATLQDLLSGVTSERDQLQAELKSQEARIATLESLSAQQANEIAALYARIAELTGQAGTPAPQPNPVDAAN